VRAFPFSNAPVANAGAVSTARSCSRFLIRATPTPATSSWSGAACDRWAPFGVGLTFTLSRRFRLALSDLDHRTNTAKNNKALMAELTADLGGDATLSAAQRALIERCAVIVSMLQHAEVRWLTGQDVDIAGYSALGSMLLRMLAALGLKRVPRVVMDLATYIATKGKPTSMPSKPKSEELLNGCSMPAVRDAKRAAAKSTPAPEATTCMLAAIRKRRSWPRVRASRQPAWNAHDVLGLGL
jgi:hypothetical protein